MGVAEDTVRSRVHYGLRALRREDYDSVRADFEHFREWIAPGGFVAFHDYAPGFPA